VLFFDESISYFFSHLRSVRKYFYVFAIVFVKRFGRFRSITIATGSWSKRTEPDVKLSSINWFAGRSVVSWYHFYSRDVYLCFTYSRTRSVYLGYWNIVWSECLRLWVFESPILCYSILQITTVPSASLTPLWWTASSCLRTAHEADPQVQTKFGLIKFYLFKKFSFF
jgi:hypothetical protein